MADVSTWSPAAGGNNANPPDGWPEGMNREDVNDTARETHAAVRRLAEDGSWFDWGHMITYISGTQFQPATGDLTAAYSVGRRVRAVGSTTGTIYGIITGSTFATNTTVTVAWDSGSLQSESLAVSLGPDSESVGQPNLGTAAFQNVGVAIGDVVQLENVGGLAGMPAVDGSQLTNLPTPASQMLSEQVTTASGSVVFTDPSWFAAPWNVLRWDFEDVVVTTGQNLWVQVSTDGGSSYLAGTNYVVGDLGVDSGGAVFSNRFTHDRFGLAGDISGSTNFDGVSGWMEFHTYRTNTRLKMLSDSVWPRITGGFTANKVWGYLAATVSINAMRFVPSTGVIAGTFRLTGKL